MADGARFQHDGTFLVENEGMLLHCPHTPHEQKTFLPTNPKSLTPWDSFPLAICLDVSDDEGDY